MLSSVFPFVLPTVLFGVAAFGDDPQEDVRQLVLGYAEAVYEAKPELIDRGVHPELAKLGLVRGEGREEHDSPMSFEELRKLCEKGYPSEPARRDVEVLGVLDQIACVKITADWGIDYMQLGREADGWKIRHVLWQSHPGIAGEEIAAGDRDAIRKAATDYIDGFYLAEPERIDRSVAKDLVKFGYYRPAGASRSMPMPMTFDQLRSLAANLHAETPPADDAPHEVEILDALDHMALVKVVGAWGIDYMHVAKRDGDWQILHVIWQSHPEAPDADTGG